MLVQHIIDPILLDGVIVSVWKNEILFTHSGRIHHYPSSSSPSNGSGESKIRFHSLMSGTSFLLLSTQVSTKLRNSPTIDTRVQYFLLR